MRCASEFEIYPVLDGVRMNFRGRKLCLACRPHRFQQRPRRRVSRPVRRPVRSLVCESCGAEFPSRLTIGGVVRTLYRRKFCLDCSGFGTHNTSKRPSGITDLVQLKEHRRRRRNAKTYRSQKKRRKQRKAELVAARGGKCMDCGYSECFGALEFHHRDRQSKDFGLGNFGGSLPRLLDEAEKCDLVCANCHRLRHLTTDPSPFHDQIARIRRERKQRAVRLMGDVCFGCGKDWALTLFEFHHREAASKDFGIGQDGIPRRWDKVAAELAKCVMLCANCHREVHAGVRELDQGLLGLAEDTLQYVA
jgi:hypothetical protein